MHKVKTATLAALFVILLIITAIPATTASPRWWKPKVPSASEIYGWTEDLVEIGLKDGSPGRRAGTPAAWEAAEYIEDRFIEFGLQDVRLEPYYPTLFTVDDWGLEVSYNGVTESIATYPVWYTSSTGSDGITAEMVYVGSGTNPGDFTDVAGKIVVVDVTYVWLPFANFPVWYIEDPAHQDKLHLPHISPNLRLSYTLAEAYGAIGWVGILADKAYDFPEFCQTQGSGWLHTCGTIPGLFVGRVEGAHLRELVTTYTVTADLLEDATVTDTVDYNVVGVLPGKSEETILYGFHHDSWFDGASDNAVGCGVGLAVAKYFGQLPATTRDKTLVFLSQGGHEIGIAGTNAFVVEHEDDILKDVVMHINIEHVANYATEEEVGPEWAGKVQSYCGVFCPDIPVIRDIVVNAEIENKLIRKPCEPDWGPLGVASGDPAVFWARGIRTICMISGPEYYHTPEDSMDKILIDELVPTTKFFIDITKAMDFIPTTLWEPRRFAYDPNPPLPNPVYTMPYPETFPPVPRSLYLGLGRMSTDDYQYCGKGILYIAEDAENAVYLGIDGSTLLDNRWTIVNKWEYNGVLYKCQSELGTLWVHVRKKTVIARGDGVFFFGCLYA